MRGRLEEEEELMKDMLSIRLAILKRRRDLFVRNSNHNERLVNKWQMKAKELLENEKEDDKVTEAYHELLEFLGSQIVLQT